MSQNQTQSINPIGPDGSVSCYHGQKVWLQTSHTSNNPNRKFFTCCKPKGSPDGCGFFFWLSALRQDPHWDEARFREYNNIPPGEEIDNVPGGQSTQKRQVQGEMSFGSSQSPKRFRRNDEDPSVLRESNPVTPTRNGGDHRRRIPLTPPSTSRVTRELVDVLPSPSEGRALRMRGSHSLHLQNFEGGMEEISPLTGRESPQTPTGSSAAQELEFMINTLNCYPDLIRKLERKAAADRSSLEARMRRVHQLETEVDQLRKENEKLHKEMARLRRENERLAI